MYKTSNRQSLRCISAVDLALVIPLFFLPKIALAIPVTGENPPQGNHTGAALHVNNAQRAPSEPQRTSPLIGRISNVSRRLLENGALLLAPEQNTLVQTSFAEVRVSANCLVLIVTTNNTLSVYNMHDTKRNAVVVNGGGYKIELSPGRCLVLVNGSAGSFEEVNVAQFVYYRRLTVQALCPDRNLYQAEFNIMSMISGLPPLRKLMTSENLKTRKLMDSVLKTAACLVHVSHYNAPFRPYLYRPEIINARDQNWEKQSRTRSTTGTRCKFTSTIVSWKSATMQASAT